MIVIGLGAGRTGTASLAKLVNAQTDALCFHEMNPSCVRFEGTPRPILNTIEEFERILDGGPSSELTVDLGRGVAAKAYDALSQMGRVRLIGDIAFYYLTYAERIAERSDRVRFLCLKRDREATIESWMRKSELERWPSKRIADRLASAITRAPYHESRNFWMEHDGSRWALDPVWDKCFPKFRGPEKRDAIAQYYDYYYEEAARIAPRIGSAFRIIETEKLNDPALQPEILSWLGVSPEDQVEVDAHIHQSRANAA